MKKYLVLIFICVIAFSLSGCNKRKEVKILVPNGTPELSQMYIEQNKDKYNYNIDKADGADALSAAFLSKSYDFIYAPINIGIKMYINNKNYKLLATVVDLNYYFVYKNDTELTLNDLKAKKIVIFGENAISGIITRYVLGNYSELNIMYVNSLQESVSEYIKDNNVVVLVSEPQLSILENKVTGTKALSIKDEYIKLDGINIPQAAVFYRSDLDEKIVNEYNDLLIESINKVNEDIVSSAELGSNINKNFSKEILKTALTRAEIKYTSSEDSKERVEKLIDFLNNYNSKILNGNVDEGFYR